MVALRQLGVDMAPFITGLGVSGFILGFAFKDALGNLAAGVMISINRPFRIGDLIETAGQLGVVDRTGSDGYQYENRRQQEDHYPQQLHLGWGNYQPQRKRHAPRRYGRRDCLWRQYQSSEGNYF